MIEANFAYPMLVLNLVVRYGVKNYLNIGTGLPYDLNMYGFSKNELSMYAKFICDRKDFNFADLKLEMFYGGLFERQDRFVNLCNTKLQKDETLKLVTDVQKRDIIRVDVVEIIDRIILANYVKGYSWRWRELLYSRNNYIHEESK